jgi:predicted nucleotidyltransferase
MGAGQNQITYISCPHPASDLSDGLAQILFNIHELSTMDTILREFLDELRNHFGKKLTKVILFGSRARGDSSAESDYDLLLIFDAVIPEKVRFVEALADRWLLERGAVISPVCLDEPRLALQRFEPFLMNATREGVSL